MQPTHKYCPVCKQPAALDVQQCSSCGHKYRTQFAATPAPHGERPAAPPIPVSPSLPRTIQNTRCPQCGNDTSTQKISALVATGTWSGHQSGTAISVGPSGQWAHGAYSGSHFGATQLAQRLAPPQPPPKNPFSLVRVISLISLGLATMLAPWPGTTTAPAAWIAPLCLGMLLLFTDLLTRRVQKRRFAEAMARHSQELALWSALWYCPRCDTAFDPASGQIASLI
jgi:hypothetical protein